MVNKIFKIATKVILYCLVVMLIYVASKLLYGQVKGKAVYFGDYSILKITSNSMANIEDSKNGINAGDYILVKKVEASDLRIDDVISFYSNDLAIKGQINTHRIVAIKNDNDKVILTTKGDNNQQNDVAKVYENNVIGRLNTKLVVLTSIVNFLTRNVYIVVILVIVLIVYSVVFIRNGLKETKSNDK